MGRILFTIGCLGLAVLPSSGQSSKISFEVATVKPAPPDREQIPDRIAEVLLSQGGPGTQNPERINYSGMTLKMLLQRAYGLKPAEISGPGWMESERYDVVAKVPPGTNEDGFRLMLQGLLTERFQIASHRETKTLQVYLLTVAKGGPKLKEAAPVVVSDDPEERKAARLKILDGALKQPFTLIRGGTPWSSFGINGTVEQFAAALSGRTDRLVRNMTNLTGNFSFHLAYVLDGAKPSADGSIGPFLFEAVEEQLGLQLQPANEKTEVLLIDKAEKVPASN